MGPRHAGLLASPHRSATALTGSRSCRLATLDVRRRQVPSGGQGAPRRRRSRPTRPRRSRRRPYAAVRSRHRPRGNVVDGSIVDLVAGRVRQSPGVRSEPEAGDELSARGTAALAVAPTQALGAATHRRRGSRWNPSRVATGAPTRSFSSSTVGRVVREHRARGAGVQSLRGARPGRRTLSNRIIPCSDRGTHQRCDAVLPSRWR